MKNTIHFDVAAELDGLRLSRRRRPERYLWSASVAAGMLVGVLAVVTKAALWGLPVVGLLAGISACMAGSERAWAAATGTVRRSLRAGLRQPRAPGFRESAAERYLEIDGRAIPAAAVQAVQVRRLARNSGAASMFSFGLFILFSDEAVLVELGERQEKLLELAALLRDALGLPRTSDPTGPVIGLGSAVLPVVVLGVSVAFPVMLAEHFRHFAGDALASFAVGSACAAAVLTLSWVGGRLFTSATRAAIRRDVPSGLQGRSPAASPSLPAFFEVSLSHDANGLHLSAPVGQRWLVWLRRTPLLVALAVVVLAAIDESSSFAATPLLFMVLAVRWGIDRNSLSSAVRIDAPQGPGDEVEAFLDVEGRRWSVGDVREVMVGAIPHARLPFSFCVYILLPGHAVEVGGLGNAGRALALAAVLRTVLRVPHVTDDRPRSVPAGWSVAVFHVAYLVSLAVLLWLGTWGFLWAVVSGWPGRPAVTAGVAVGLLAFDRIAAALRPRLARRVARRLAGS